MALQADGAAARLEELCSRSAKQQMSVFTRFLAPPEAVSARQAARDAGMEMTLSGGYPDAERVMACFHPPGETPDFPIACLRIAWDGRYGQADHRAVLGSVLALGIDRSLVGDILLSQDGAFLLAVREMASFIAEGMDRAGGVPVKVQVLEEIPPLKPQEGTAFRRTVASLRLDAVLAAGLDLSRSDAAALVLTGCVQVNHRPELRPDHPLAQGDLLSIRGYGRLALKQEGPPNRKGRIPILLESYGIRTQGNPF